jgi:hypothetical protein
VLLEQRYRPTTFFPEAIRRWQSSSADDCKILLVDVCFRCVQVQRSKQPSPNMTAYMDAMDILEATSDFTRVPSSTTTEYYHKHVYTCALTCISCLWISCMKHACLQPCGHRNRFVMTAPNNVTVGMENKLMQLFESERSF